MNITLASFDWLYARDPEYFCSPMRSSKSILPIACAPDETVTTRAGALAIEPFEQQVRQQERREMIEGERVLQAVGGDVAVVPEAADVVEQHIEPRIGGETSPANRRTSAWDDMSATKTSIAGLPDSAAIAGGCGLGPPRSRPVMPTLAPKEASPMAAARPIPPVPPVIKTVLSRINGVALLTTCTPIPIGSTPTVPGLWCQPSLSGSDGLDGSVRVLPPDR